MYYKKQLHVSHIAVCPIRLMCSKKWETGWTTGVCWSLSSSLFSNIFSHPWSLFLACLMSALVSQSIAWTYHPMWPSIVNTKSRFYNITLDFLLHVFWPLLCSLLNHSFPHYKHLKHLDTLYLNPW